MKLGDAVIATREMSWIHGSGLVVPEGTELTLRTMHHTTSGERWSATWDHDDCGIVVYPIPPDAIRLKGATE